MPNTNIDVQTRLQEIIAEMLNLYVYAANNVDLDHTETFNKLSKLTQEFIELKDSIELNDIDPEKLASGEYFENFWAWLNTIKHDLKENKNLIFMAGLMSSYSKEFHAAKMIAELFEKIYNQFDNVYKNFHKMSVDEKIYAICGLTLMIGGFIALGVAIANVPGVSIFQAVASITLGSILANESTKQIKDPNLKKIHEAIIELTQSILDFFLKPILNAFNATKNKEYNGGLSKNEKCVQEGQPANLVASPIPT